jgi:hypothetical protein
MNNAQSLIATATSAAREFEAQAARPATQLEIAQLVMGLRDRLTIWASVPAGTTCLAVWKNLRAA